MGILAQIIWMYLLRAFTKEKSQWINNFESVDECLIQKSRMDAVTYGEGMYQLIENACIHSAGKKAWFGIRVYPADRQAAMSSFKKEANYRNTLFEKYKRCFKLRQKDGQDSWDSKNIFNADDRFFFELFVLDDAYDKKGILSTFNERLWKNNQDIIYEKFKELWKKTDPIDPATGSQTSLPSKDNANAVNPMLWNEAKELTKDICYHYPEKISEIIKGLDLAFEARPTTKEEYLQK